MTETVMKHDIKQLLRDQPIMLQEIEYPRVPDLFFRHFYFDGWIELKVISNYSPQKFKIPFRPGQYAWILNYMRRGGQVFLFTWYANAIWVHQNQHIHREYTQTEFVSTAKGSIYTGFNFYPEEVLRLLGGST